MATKYDNMTMAQLREAASVAADRKAEYDEIVKGVKAEIAIRAKDAVLEAYKEKGEETGTARAVIDGVPLKFNRSKKVVWDQKALREIARQLPKDEAKKLIKLDLKVSETDFNAVESPWLKEALEDAREITAGKASVDFEIKVT